MNLDSPGGAEDASPPRPTGRWLRGSGIPRWQLVVDVLALIVAVLTLISNYFQLGSSHPPPLSAPGPQVPAMTAGPPHKPLGTTVPGDPSSECMLDSGEPVGCDVSGAWLRREIHPCDEAGAVSYLMPTGPPISLDIETRRFNDACMVRPGRVVKSVASTADLTKLDTREALSRVTKCLARANDPQSPQLPCTHAHHAEYVTNWTTGSGSPERCTQEAARYVAENLAGINARFTAEVWRSDGRHRCVVASKTPLNGTVWHLDDGPLP